jgi:hypothetical protein
MADFYTVIPVSLVLLVISLFLVYRSNSKDPVPLSPYSQSPLNLKDLYGELITHSQSGDMSEVLNDLESFLQNAKIDILRKGEEYRTVNLQKQRQEKEVILARDYSALVKRVEKFGRRLNALKRRVLKLQKKKKDGRNIMSREVREVETEFFSLLDEFLIVQKGVTSF